MNKTKKMSLMLNHLVKMTADFESTITSVERINEYCSTESHEVKKKLKFYFESSLF